VQREINKTTNILFAGIGGQGIILASEITCDVLFESGYDVKKSEVHGMSQRGGSVNSDIRFGAKVYSPLIPDGQTDILVAFHPTELERNRPFLKSGGKIISITHDDADAVSNPKVSNIFLMGKLSCHIPVRRENWENVIKNKVPKAYVEQNLAAFAAGISQEQKINNK
jgi:indolepyruvate ferredoxin oxidoreductase beta subunit